jgi:histidinol-phosphate aminotransferase
MSARAAIAAMTAYTLELREAEIKLNQNESPEDFPENLKQEVLAQVARRRWNLYPDFEAVALRTALARAHGLDAGNILAGNGSNELLAAAVSTFAGPGTPVVYPRPSFSLYEKLITVAGASPRPVAVDASTGTLPLDAMLEALGGAADQPPVVIVCSPNNPTGGVLPAGGLERLLATGATVLFDRAYGDFAGDQLPPLHDRLVTFSTFSKAWGLAGLRTGWLATTAATASEIRKVKLPYSLNIISETAAIVALENPSIRDENVARTVAERARVMAALESIDGVTPFPSQANFIAFRLRRNARRVFDELCARGLLVRDISSAVPNALRVSIGAAAENDRFLEALKEIA